VPILALSAATLTLAVLVAAFGLLLARRFR